MKGKVIAMAAGACLLLFLFRCGEDVFSQVRNRERTTQQTRATLTHGSHSEKRTRSMRKDRTTDPVGAYAERAKRGLTDREIQAILREFTGSGLADMEMFFGAASKRSRVDWYEAALADGLSLSREQRAEARQKLDNLMQQSEPPDLPSSVGFQFWWPQPELAPWRLYALTPSQALLTGEAQFQELKGQMVQPEASSGLIVEPDWVFPLPSTFDPKTGQRTPRSVSVHESTPYLRISEILPLIPEQLSYVNQPGISLLNQVRHLHPAQLRLSLLLNPHQAREIQYQLDSSKPQVETSAEVESE